MSDSCNLSSEAEKEICKDEMINASVSMIPGIGPVIGNAIQRVTAYEKKINKDEKDTFCTPFSFLSRIFSKC